jgi:hypothetical protein
VPEFLIDDHSFQVLKSFRPFLGDRGNGYVTTLESLQELLTSEPAQKTLQSFRLFGIAPKFKSMEVVGEAVANPFNLFLILILLLLADLPGGVGPHASAYDVEPGIPVQFV